MKAIVLMPTFNEVDNLATSIAALRAVLPQIDLLIIDDNSPDGTKEVAKKHLDDHTFLMERTKKTGLGDAYIAGIDWALNRDYQLLIEMDADGSHLASDLPALIAAAEHNDLVLGSRWVSGGEVTGWPMHRKLISKIGNRYAKFMLRTGLNDMTSGFRVYRASLLRDLNLKTVSARGYAFQVEMALRSFRAGASVVEVPITFVERAHGNSKMTTAIVLEALWLVTKWGIYRSA